MAQTVEATKKALASHSADEATKVVQPDRRFIDLMISWSGAVVAVALVALGAAAIYGGTFALDNVRGPAPAAEHQFPACRRHGAGGEGRVRSVRR